MLLSKGKSGPGQRAPEAKSINRLPFTYAFTFLRNAKYPMRIQCGNEKCLLNGMVEVLEYEGLFHVATL